ncbi:MAG: Rpn family recombination-promoting nuclease/putative transposase [Clostridium sp.]|nr:Rpn family recombination-promoting nuclease/putative transposase [Clostridium sp.]
MENEKEFSTVWESLRISNDFMFGKVMQDAELCKELLQRILPDLEIDHIEYPEAQKAIRLDADAKSVRLDVYVRDGKGTVYDIEMQVADTKELPKRSRYYQSMIDLQMIDKGQSYKKLKPSYVIFISPFDIFGKGKHIYTFENICKEDTSITLKDEAVKIFLNADSSQDDVSKELKAFLDYVAGKESEDDFVQRLEEAVKEARKNREWRHEYMTLLMRDQENMEKGMERGKSVGEEMMLLLIQKLVDNNRVEDISRIKDDIDYRRKLYKEYNISI